MNLRTLLALLTIATSAAAQTYTTRHIVFKNPGGFSQPQLEAAAQLHPGATATADTLAAAAQRLADTGYFDNVAAALDGTAADTSAIFTLTPTPRTHMLHTGFVNFVWLTHADIEAAIHKQLPLFNDFLPDGSPLSDTIDAALTAALAAHTIQAKVTHEVVEPTLQHPERTLEFRIDTPEVRVANVKLAGVTPDLVPLIQKSVNATAHTRYNDGLSGLRTADSILAPLLDAGYIDAQLANISLTTSPMTEGAYPLIVSATLRPNDIYKVSTFTFAGTPLLSAESFQSTQKLHPNDIASRKLLLETLVPLDTAYRRQGYMDVILQTSPVLDKTAHTVAYTITATPGEQYHVHEVKAGGLDPAAEAEFKTGFLLKQGDLYNPDYIAQFVKNNTSLKALAAYNGTWKAYADPNNHTTDVILNFSKGDPTTTVTVH